MAFEFSIKAWSAYAEGLDSCAAWQAWALDAWLPTGDAPPGLPEMPAVSRRRLGPLGRMAAQTGYWCQPPEAGSMPVVLASRYGEAERSLELMRELANGSQLSPTAFGLSVHNAIGAQYSIARADQENYLSVAGGSFSAVAGVVEAVSLLADGADAVLLICYDAPLPGRYAVFADEPACHFAWAWVLEPARKSVGGWFSLRAIDESAQGDSMAVGLPHDLAVLRFVLSGDSVMSRTASGRTWQWLRHA